MINIPYRAIFLWVLLYFAFLFQGTVFYWLLPEDWVTRVVPHFVLIGVVYIALFRSRHYALVVGLAFGFLHDLMYYGHMLGVYTFTMGLIGYFCGLAFQKKFVTFFYVVSVIGLGCFGFDVIVYFIYRLFRIVNAPLEWALMEYILPSLLFNMFCAMLVYIPVRKYMEALAAKRAEEEAD